jgi:ATP-dependent helicase HepA
MAEFILRRVPRHLDELNEEVVLAACRRLGLEVEPQRQPGTWLIELGAKASVESLPGVTAAGRFLGTFQREHAVADEGLDYFAAGHPLVEGVLAELADSPRGRTALLAIEAEEPGFVLLALYKDDAGFTAVAVDQDGRLRPEWAARLSRPPLRTRRVRAKDWTRQPGWRDLILRLAAPLAGRGRPLAAAAVRLLPRGG